MKKRYLIWFAALTLAACTSKSTDTSQTTAMTETNPKLTKLFDEYYEERLKFFPLEATSQGDNRYNDQLPNDISQEFIGQTKSFYEKYLSQLQAISRDSLSDQDKIGYDVLERDLKIQLEGIPFHTEEIPFQQFWGLPLQMGMLGSGDGSHPFHSVKDYDDWLKRAASFTVWADTAIGNFKKGMADGVVLPKSLVVKMIPQMNDLVVADPTKSIFYGPVNKFPEDFSDADKTRLTEAFKKAITTQIVPAYKKMGDFLKNEYLPKARTTSGIGVLPKGKELYAYYVRFWTTTNKTPEEIFELGEKEVARIKGEMEAVKNQVGFKGDLKAFFDHLKDDPKFYPYKTPEDVLKAFQNIHDRIKPNVAKIFNKTPKTPFEIRRTEAFREASASAEYQPGSADGSRPGIFYVPIPDAKKFNITSGMESLFLHEAIPGHHYQMSLQQENTALPKFMRFMFNSAYGEGWALYTESLGKELGVYTDPYQYMGALGDEMHRAIRLVVDVAIHTKGWTREQAIKYMMDNEPIAEQGAVAEIERYMAVPGQALSYKIGALKIRELRAKYEKELGNKFSLAAFHDEFLKDGCLPLDVLERKMDAWAAAQK
ncbi:DUF885 domain-containing protein [Xanthocytophaga flava]|uniref:DUF885 domain-containing protein n=1 Tax=Xanthocytophaga flava TaxID=3048013 RepID=UPI0028D1E753|nr:DUF885 domain-containing protein [Xanthocytophaga flavus]MDJ1471716.1 DUF885 domain-containing protein [Xanthocytophaga flavus]